MLETSLSPFMVHLACWGWGFMPLVLVRRAFHRRRLLPEQRRWYDRPYREKAVLRACEQGDWEQVKKHRDLWSPGLFDEHGLTPLMHAVIHRDLTMVQALVPFSDGEAVSFLYDSRDQSQGGGETALMLAAKNGTQDMVEALLPISRVAQRSGRDLWDHALGLAVEQNNVGAVRALAKVADLHQPNCYDSLPFLKAVQSEKVEIVRELVKACDGHYPTDAFGKDAYMLARHTGNPELLHIFLEADRQTLQQIAAEILLAPDVASRPRL